MTTWCVFHALGDGSYETFYDLPTDDPDEAWALVKTLEPELPEYNREYLHKAEDK